jgi:hypothetical protein
MKGGVALAGADAERLAVVGEFVETLDLVDIDEMRGLRQAERHDRHQALPAGENAAIVAGDLGEDLQRLVEAARDMADEGRGLHAASFLHALEPGKPAVGSGDRAFRDCMYANDRAGGVNGMLAPREAAVRASPASRGSARRCPERRRRSCPAC